VAGAPGSELTQRLTTGTGEAVRLVRAPGRRAFLLVHHREGVEAVPLPVGGSVVVGREPPADVVIADKSLSRRHARFTLAGADEVTVEDLGSTNGTKVSGQRVERAAIRPGDEVVLGSLSASIFLASDVDAARLGLTGNDAFRSAVDVEIERARFFGRPFALVVAQPLPGQQGHLPRWCARVRAEVRPVDRVALYGGSTIEILLPEVGAEQAAEISRALVAPREGEPLLAAGVAAFLESGTVADELVEAALSAVRRATPGAPVQLAETLSLRTLVPGRGADEEEGPILQSPATRARRDSTRARTCAARAVSPFASASASIGS
jgi:hypothetical protein